MPEIPQSEIVATIFFGGRETGRKIGRNIGRNLEGVLVLCSLCRITQKKILPKFPAIITPCPANEMSKFHLRELLGLEGAKNFKEIGKHQRFPEWSWRSFRRNWWRTSGEVWKEIFELLLLGKIVRSIFHQNSTANFTIKTSLRASWP